MEFKDTDGNFYYTEDDELFVKGANFVRKIGKLTTNLTTGKMNLVLHRSANEKTNFGWLVSSVAVKHLNINTIVLIVDNEEIYLLDWDAVKSHRKEWSFKPKNGMELQMVIPDVHWTAVKPDTGIVVVSE